MTQKIGCRTYKSVLYFRAQASALGSHKESAVFSEEAQRDFIQSFGLEEELLELGPLRFGQARPSDEHAKLI
ncbi:MAG: hypothetical protein AAFV95_14535 [Bacteroidota bacterium]